MKIVCDACSAKYSIADEKVRGKVFKIRCKKCSNIIVVRGATEEAEKQAAEALEQKETRVFDYSGYDDPQAAVAAADESAASGAIWHIVVDQEQVGPMTSEEVRSYAARGDIDAESYIWREGFDDWLGLSTVPEFADLGAPAAAPAAAAPSTDSAAAAMFGAPATEDVGAAASDPADIFSAQAQGAANLGDDGGGLFGDVGGAPMTAAAPEADGGLFGSAPEPEAEAAAGNGSPNLTGQRSENSVLFSLNNLASLASEAPKAAPAPSASAAPAGMAQSGGQEGSGLIDIRSMAQVYLGDKGASPAAPGASTSASIDDLPIFSQPSFESAAPVLLPASAPANQNKLLYGLIAAVGVLVVAAIVLLVVVLKGGDDDEGGKTLAAGGGDDVTNNKAGGDGDGDGDKPDGTKAAGDGDGDGDGKTTTSATSGDGDGDGAGAAVKQPKVDDKPKKPEKPKTAAELKREREREKKKKEEREKRRQEREEKKRLEAEKKKNKAKSGGCDEVACLVDPSKACCKKGSSSSSSSNKPKVDSSLPEKLGRSDISRGMGKVNGRARSCGNKHSGSGKVAVRITVGGSGRVTRASASGATPALRSCVARAVKRAKFKRTQKGARFTYKYSF